MSVGIDYTKRPSRPDVPPPPPSASSGSSPAAPPGNTKVSLTKAAPTVSLTKQGSASGTLRVNLNWNARPPQMAKGLFGRSQSAAIDLDLGCLYEYADGSKGAVQALGNAFNDRHTYSHGPICRLDADDRSGMSTGGENLFVELAYAAEIRRVLVYAFIYEGSPNWAEANAVVTLFPVTGPQIEVRLDEHDPQSRMCAIAMLDNRSGQLDVRREVRYVHGMQKALDEAFGWGMQWKAGRK